jgi:hypothetical protein
MLLASASMPSATIERESQSPNDEANANRMSVVDAPMDVAEVCRRRRDEDKNIERTHFYKCIRVNVLICKCIGVFVPSYRNANYHCTAVCMWLLRLVVPIFFLSTSFLSTMDFLVNADKCHLTEALALYIGIYLWASQTMLSAAFCFVWFWNG